ncbi:hypothetical protein ABPG77_004263 [Micractinium sp. CCAP 211/92]
MTPQVGLVCRLLGMLPAAARWEPTAHRRLCSRHLRQACLQTYRQSHVPACCLQESAVQGLDEATGASLKLSILNPKGRIWTMVAGGGASVIYADTVGDLGYAHELGNYAEYSGGPSTAETHAYARTLLDAATANPDGRGRALIVGGGIANFTNVAATFKGIIQAFRERAAAIKASKMKIFVRRGGPNYKAGLDMMRALGAELGVPIEVYGPEASMTGICQHAIDYISSFDTNGGQ